MAKKREDEEKIEEEKTEEEKKEEDGKLFFISRPSSKAPRKYTLPTQIRFHHHHHLNIIIINITLN